MPADAPRTDSPRDIVLVVDDSPGTLGMLTDALEEAGYTVLVATDGAAAVGVVERVTPDIVLMDALMPGMDGFETCRRIKQRQDLANVPVIFMTGLKDTESVVKGLGAGGVDYVTKPTVPDEIIARIKVHLANARLARSAQAALDTSGRFLLAVDPAGAVSWLTPQARRLLADGAAENNVGLPTGIADWLHRVTTTAERGRDRFPFTLSHTSRQLECSFVGRIGPQEFLLRLVETSGVNSEARLREKLDVTAREAEVLLWLARGKQNRDIADILGMSPRTVNKHLEQIYNKLGVDNRSAATARALGVLKDDE